MGNTEISGDGLVPEWWSVQGGRSQQRGRGGGVLGVGREALGRRRWAASWL